MKKSRKRKDGASRTPRKGEKKDDSSKDEDVPTEPKKFTDQGFVTKLMSLRKEEDILKIEQSIYFLNFLNEIFEMAKDTKQKVEKVAETIKGRLLEYSTKCVRKPLTITNTEDEESDEKGSSRKKRKKKSARTKGSGKKSGRKGKEVQEEVKDVEKEIPPLFSPEEIGKISTHILQGVLQHFHLYKDVFNHERPKDVEHVRLTLTTPFPPVPYLKMQKEEDFLGALAKEKQLVREANELKRKQHEDAMRQSEHDLQRRLQEEEARRNAPVLTDSQLVEVSNYLQYQLSQELQGKREDYVKRIEEVAKRMELIAKEAEKNKNNRGASRGSNRGPSSKKSSRKSS